MITPRTCAYKEQLIAHMDALRAADRSKKTAWIDLLLADPHDGTHGKSLCCLLVTLF